MRTDDMRLSREELPLWAQLVAAAWKRTQKNPSAEECRAMVATARAMAECDAVLQ
jgi:hypothetical protein